MVQTDLIDRRRILLSGIVTLGSAARAAGAQRSGFGNLPKKAKIDTSGKGNLYSGLAGEEEVRRAYFNQTGGSRIELGFSGPKKFKLMLYAELETQHSDRRLTLRLVGSDRGGARGYAEVKFNRDLNEIEAMMISGEVQGQRFAGDFRRSE